MILTLIISMLTCLFLVLSVLLFPKIKIFNITLSTYWIVCFIGAILLICFQTISLNDIYNNLFSNTSINPIKILILFFSMTYISIYLDELGFFKFLASKASHLAKNNQFQLFTIFYFLVAILTIFTSNDIVILTFTPFICYFSKNAKINPLPYLIGEFAAANTFSMSLIIGNPTNIYLATSYNIDFMDYLKVMLIPTIVCGFFQYLLLLFVFRNKLKIKMEFNNDIVHLNNKVNIIIGLISLLTCLILLIISSYIGIEMYIVSFLCAMFLIIFEIVICLIKGKKQINLGKTISRLPYELIPFMISMFVIVLCLNKQGISSNISKFLGQDQQILRYGIASFLTCNIMNNIPMSVLFSSLVTNQKALYASVVGSNLGAILTPIGALAGIMFMNLLNKYDIKFSFKDYTKYGIIISIPTLAICLLTLKFMF